MNMNTITSTPLRTLVAGAILTAFTFSFAAASRADDGTVPPQVMVKFADLDVSTSQGAAALYGRIYSAAVDVCSRMYVVEQAYRWHKNACLQKVIGDAVIKVNRPALSAVFASKFGVSPTVVLAAAGTR
jgi:UrcA family protein